MDQALATPLSHDAKLLLIDTCGEAAGVALSQGDQVLEQEQFMARSASADIVIAVRRLLQSVGWRLADLTAVGVVNGPGSFTGVRTGLAAAKGFCEATGLKLAAVSRLAVLMDAAAVAEADPHSQQRSNARASTGSSAIAVLDAGRGEFFVRGEHVVKSTEHPANGQASREWLCSLEELRALCAGRQVIVAEEQVAERLAGCSLLVHPLTAADALRPVLHRLRQGGTDVGTVDANYVRGESDLYRAANAAARGGTARRPAEPS